MLRGMQSQDFPVFFHRRAERRILERVVRALNHRAEAGVRARLVKVKAHSSEPLNTLADHLATSSAGQDPTLAWLDPHTVYVLHPGSGKPATKLKAHTTRAPASRHLMREGGGLV